MDIELQQITMQNRGDVNTFITEHWFTLQMLVHGECIDLGTAEGWCAREGQNIVGLITYRVLDKTLEILSLDSLRENSGIGSLLLNKVVSEAERRNCSRIMLITTNDNLNALRFYQKRGFDMVKLYLDAVNEARKIKPEIPFLGDYDIPLKHEIELEKKLI